MIEFVKKGIRKAFIIFLPIFVAFFIGLLSFVLVTTNIVGRATLSVSAVSALLGYRFVIENIMPKVDYFTLTDYIYIILLGLAFSVFIIQTLLLRQQREIDKQEQKGKTLAIKKMVEQWNENLRFINDIAFITVILLTLIFVGYVVMR